MKKLLILLISLINIACAFEIYLNDAEKKYLQNNKVTIGMVNDYYPFSYKENGKINGFSYEYIHLIASKIDLNFDIELNDWSPTLNKFKNKQIDIIDAISYTKEREAFTNFSDPYFEIPNVIFARKNSITNYDGLGSLKGKRVGITKGIYYFDTIKNLDLFELVVFKSSREKIKALALGKIDAAFNNLTSGQKYVFQGGYTNIEALDMIDEHIVKKEDLRFGIAKDNPLLHSVIDKAMKAVTTEEKLQLINKYFGIGFQEKYINTATLVDKVKLTPKEKEFLKKHPKVVLGTSTGWEPYSIENEDGTITGFEADLLQAINEVTGANFMLELGDWETMQQRAKKREIDGLATLIQTKEREEFLNFSDSYESLRKTILVKRGNPLNIRSIKDLEGKTIAIHRGNKSDENLAASINNVKILRFSKPIDMFKEVIYGDADAAVGNNVSMYLLAKEGYLYLSSAFEVNRLLALRFAVRNDWPEAMSILQKGLKAISEQKKASLLQKWLIQPMNNTFILNAKEREYLSTKKELKMCASPDHLPFEQITQEKQHKGISADIIQRVAQKINTPIKLLPTNSWTQSIENLKNRKCDILPIAIKTKERLKYMNFTDPYIIESMVVATKEDKFFIQDSQQLQNKKVALLQGAAMIEILKEKHPNIEIITVKNTKEGLKKVQKNEVFGYIDILPSIAYAMQENRIMDLKIAGQLEFELHMSIASRSDTPQLNTILQKALDDIGADEIRTIVNKWVSIKIEQSFDYRKLIYISLFFLAVLLIILYKNRSINKLNKKLKELSITDNLTQLYNRNKLDEILALEVNRANRYATTFGVIIMDVDYFKSINDVHGHQTGDTVLKEFAHILQSNSRSTDTVGRWGGEEFLIICSQTDMEGTLLAAHHLKKTIASYSFSTVGHKTASFGVSTYALGEDVKDLIKRADDALYHAKNNGRNRVESLSP